MSGTLITDIKRTKKGNNALFCADGFMFSLDDEALYRLGIDVGSELDANELERARAASDLGRARNKALCLLDLRAHAEGELYDKLRRDFDEHTCAETVARLHEVGLTDDAAFCERYAEELIVRKRTSLRAAAAKLRERGARPEDIDNALEPYAEGEPERLCELIAAKYAHRLGSRAERDKTAAALARRGFSPRDIRQALAEYDSDEPEQY